MATVTFIKYQKQSAGALRGVAGYVSQKQKTEQEDGWQLVSGQNCTPQLAAQEFIATRQMHRKDSPVWFYHYVQAFSGRGHHRSFGAPSGEGVRGAGVAGQ